MPRVAAFIEENPLACMHPVIRYLSPIKTATVADLRNNFATISKWFHNGEAVAITKRGFPFDERHRKCAALAGLKVIPDRLVKRR